MSVNIFQSLFAAGVATIVWFFIGAVVYMNPIVDNIYKKYEDHPSVKNRKDIKKFIINTFLFSILIQCVLFAFVYQYIQPVLPGALLMNTVLFGGILIAVKIIPRFFDMWVQSQYPPMLLGIEIINGAIGSFVIAFVFAVVI